MAAKTPRYQIVAETLRGGILNGGFPVGEMLPGEHHLMSQFAVSRHTVREALRILQDQGLVRRQPGLGTVVVSAGLQEAYVQSINSVDELLQYPAETKLSVVSKEVVFASKALARQLPCAFRSKWARISGIRRLVEQETPICWTDIYVLPQYAGVAQRIGQDDRPVYALIEAQYEESVQHVAIDLTASLLDQATAEALGADAGAPALTVVRRYHGARDRVFEISVSVHPADNFTYSLNLSRGWTSAN